MTERERLAAQRGSLERRVRELEKQLRELERAITRIQRGMQAKPIRKISRGPGRDVMGEEVRA